MSAQHDNFVLEIASSNFGNRVVSHRVLIVKLHLKIDGHLKFLSLLNHARESVVIFSRKSDLGGNGGGVGGPRPRTIRERICPSPLGHRNRCGTDEQSPAIAL